MFVNICDVIYPVGSVYITQNSASPADLFGGSWQKIESGSYIRATDADTPPLEEGGSTSLSHNHTTVIGWARSGSTYSILGWYDGSGNPSWGSTTFPGSGGLGWRLQTTTTTSIARGANTNAVDPGLPAYITLNFWYRVA